jgi:hypothetical protein
LQIGLFKVGKEFAVGGMLQAGDVVSHSISVSWEEEGEVATAVFLLVSTAVVAQLGGDSIRPCPTTGTRGSLNFDIAIATVELLSVPHTDVY